MKKKFLSILLAFALLICGTPVFGTNAESNQVDYLGGTTTKDNIIGTGANDTVTVSKTIESTGVENYFDITLKVDAKESTPITRPVDVVVVMDVSNSMNSDSKITYAKKALNAFIDDYSSFVKSGKIDTGSRIGVVTFNTDARVVVGMTAINDSSVASIKNTVTNIVAPKGDYEKYTNIEGGLQLGANLLKNSTAKHKYVILLTDGFPTTYINKTISGNAASTTGITGYVNVMNAVSGLSKGDDGYFYDAVTNKVCLYGVSYSDKAALKTEDTATAIKNSGTNIFSIGIQLDSQSVQTYVNQTTNKPEFAVVDRTGETYAVGNGPDDYRAWLRDDIAGGPNMTGTDVPKYSDGESESGLHTAFKKILNAINGATIPAKWQATTVDPMSTDVEFMNFYDKNGNSASSLSGSSAANAENTATFSADSTGASNGIINWDIMKSGFTKDSDGTYHFILKYRVRLLNEKAGFTPSTAIKTNNATTFSYKSQFGNDEVFSQGTIDHKLPTVEGYLGTLDFTKVDGATSDPIANTKFELSHLGDDCSVCHGDATISTVFSATSDANGRILIEDIPSGHDYVLKETASADGYYASQNYKVSVSYGAVYLYKSNGDTTTQIVNNKIEPAQASFTAIKHYDKLQADQFDYVLVSEKDSSGNANKDPYANVNETNANDANGYAPFTVMPFDEVGTYYFSIKEIQGTNPSIIYDKTVYDLKVDVVLRESTEANPNGLGSITTKWYEAQISLFDGSTWAPVTEFAKSVHKDVPFVSRDRDPGSAIITAKKDTAAVDTGVAAPSKAGFVFNLKDSTGAVIDTAISDSNGDVKFDKLDYYNAGTYTYTISEDSTQIYDFDLDDFVPVEDTHLIFDDSIYTATVTVSAPQDDSAFVTAVSYKDDNQASANAAVFTNTDRGAATLTLSGIKELDGAAPNADQFSFTIKEVGGSYSESVKNDANGIFNFTEFSYDDIAGELKTNYHYTITEDNVDDTSIYMDDSVYHLYVEVGTDGTLNTYTLSVSLTVEGENGAEIPVYETSGPAIDLVLDNSDEYCVNFSNLTRPDTHANIVAKKDTAAIDADIEAPSKAGFVFHLKDFTGEIIDTAVSDENGDVTFNTLYYGAVGTYTYTICEDNTQIYDYSVNDFVPVEDTHIIFDNSVYTVTVTVSAIQGVLEYATDIEYKDETNAPVDKAIFTNSDRGAATLTLSGLKELDETTPAAEQFSFTISEVDGEYTESVKNDENGIFTFTKLIFDDIAGELKTEYHYIITEDDVEDTSIYMDRSVYHLYVYVDIDDTLDTYALSVSLTVEGEDGEEIPVYETSGPAIEIALGDEEEYCVSFANKTRIAVDVPITAEKLLDGVASSREFTFVLEDSEGNIVGTAVCVDGVITFEDLSFNAAGEYWFKLYEKATDDDTIIFDTTVYDILINVVPSDIEATYIADVFVTMGGEGVEKAVFKNETKPIQPDTGDNIEMIVIWSIALLAAAVVLFVTNRKQVKSKD